MIKTIFEQWLDGIVANLNKGIGINIERDKVPVGVETIDELERERANAAREKAARTKALRKAIYDGRVCFLMYGGVDVSKVSLDKYEDGRLKIGNEKGLRRLARNIKALLTKDAGENDYAFICIPAYVKLTLPAKETAEAKELAEDVANNEELMSDDLVASIVADAKESVPDYDIVLDTDYLDKLQGKELLDFIKANAEKVDGYLFGGEAILSYVETMFGEELTSEPDENGNRFQRDCFAHNLTKVSERLKFI